MDNETPRSELQDLEGPRVDDFLYEENKNPLKPGIDPEDQLPRMIPMTKLEDTEAVPLNPDTFICMADKRQFTDGDSVYAQEELKELSLEKRIPLVPIRSKCQHYVRQLIPWKDDRDRKLCRRVCTAMKNEEGEYISLNDQEIHACELRFPQDEKSEALLDDFDEQIMATQKKTSEEEHFDPTEALGIFT